ncbi:MAG: hypothetical protein ACU0HS_07920 [Paracoccus sp. (in: a-proteobacteria)]|uniref:hypothetical protein n=1 Tax=Paracoccus sp. TaxID=267 RepID=UPI0040584A78
MHKRPGIMAPPGEMFTLRARTRIAAPKRTHPAPEVDCAGHPKLAAGLRLERSRHGASAHYKLRMMRSRARRGQPWDEPLQKAKNNNERQFKSR